MATRPRKKKKKPTQAAITESQNFAALPVEDQLLVDDIAREALSFRRSIYEYDMIIASKLNNRVPRVTARERFRAIKKEEFPPRNKKEEKEHQQQRLMTNIKAASDSRRYGDVAKLESLYADITGTREPIQIEQVLTGSLAAVIAQLTPEQHAKIVAEQRRRLELAQMAEHMLPSHVEVEVIEVDESKRDAG